VDLSQSKAYFSKTVTAETQSITLNASSKQEYDELFKLIKQKLEAFVDPESGGKVVKRMFHRSELYDGPYTNQAPDIIMILEEGYKGTTTLSGSRIIEQLPITRGTHSIDGVFLAKGLHLRKDFKLSQITLQDLAPTLLHLFGLPIPEDVDGKVKKEIFQPNSPPYRREPQFYSPKLESREAKPLTKGEEEEVLERLRDLGYLD
jgi:predicted AlkP superfamily phosphohydrolase/phosphomutase